MAKSCNVLCAVSSSNPMAVDNTASVIRMLVIATVHIVIGASVDQTVSSGNKPCVGA